MSIYLNVYIYIYIYVGGTACSTTEGSGACSINHIKNNIYVGGIYIILNICTYNHVYEYIHTCMSM